MKSQSRWTPCIYHRRDHSEPFLREFFGHGDRRILFVAGAGFDPRSTHVGKLIADIAQDRTRGVFLREERPQPQPELVRRADTNQAELLDKLPRSTIHSVSILAPDNAVVGGRRAVTLLSKIALDDATDVIIDFSALSVGVAFPIARYFFERFQELPASESPNLHLIATDEPATDVLIESTACETAAPIHGFIGGWGRDDKSRAARLWIPLLIRGKRAVLERIHVVVHPHAVCPVLPFPTSNPRLPDDLVEHYGEEFEGVWSVDARDIVYADERSPLDLYRSILRIDDARQEVFAEVGGSLVVLSPIGSKALAIGMLMAALERDFTVMYVESVSYSVDFAQIDRRSSNPASEVIHVWLHGEAYA